MRGGPTLFDPRPTRGSRLGPGDPILEYFDRTKRISQLRGRGAGSPRSEELLERDGRHWRNLRIVPRNPAWGTRVPNPTEVARAAARLFVDYAWQSIARIMASSFVALSGGNTPRMMYRLLASAEFRGQVDWAKCASFGATSARPARSSGQHYGMARSETASPRARSACKCAPHGS